MIAEALDKLVDLARKSAAPQKIDSGDPREIRYVVNGEMIAIPTDASPRAHKAKCLQEIVRLATRFDTDGVGTNVPVVWYDEHKVVLVIDDNGHRLETATFDLVPSAVFLTLAELARSKAKHDQKAFVRLLRIDLAGTLDPVQLLNSVRAVKWSSMSESTVKNQRESMGREITAACVDGKEVPETVVLQVPVYQSQGERDTYPCRCSVEVDAAEGTFRLLPLPDEITKIQQMAVSSIADRLEAGLPTSVPSYYGTP